MKLWKLRGRMQGWMLMHWPGRSAEERQRSTNALWDRLITREIKKGGRGWFDYPGDIADDTEAPRYLSDLSDEERVEAEASLAELRAKRRGLQPEASTNATLGDAADAEPEPRQGDEIGPAMSEQEIRDAGLAIDVPFEAPGPSRLRYQDGKTVDDVLEELAPELYEEKRRRRRKRENDSE